ncbi:hypothetical protein VNI00_016101 [Paramarasmius palmivorus]|uniref:Uncharacterized protein n=1 Tax=Paramarasmius palmivorus TaxID=297713 RepID=A0AAW0BH98_9AGAR
MKRERSEIDLGENQITLDPESRRIRHNGTESFWRTLRRKIVSGVCVVLGELLAWVILAKDITIAVILSSNFKNDATQSTPSNTHYDLQALTIGYLTGLTLRTQAISLHPAHPHTREPNVYGAETPVDVVLKGHIPILGSSVSLGD